MTEVRLGRGRFGLGVDFHRASERAVRHPTPQDDSVFNPRPRPRRRRRRCRAGAPLLARPRSPCRAVGLPPLLGGRAPRHGGRREGRAPRRPPSPPPPHPPQPPPSPRTTAAPPLAPGPLPT